MCDVSEIRRMLQVFDQTALAPPRQAVGMLASITKLIAAQPHEYNLTCDEGEPRPHCFCPNGRGPQAIPA